LEEIYKYSSSVCRRPGVSYLPQVPLRNANKALTVSIQSSSIFYRKFPNKGFYVTDITVVLAE
jgi:hypothetical protein